MTPERKTVVNRRLAEFDGLIILYPDGPDKPGHLQGVPWPPNRKFKGTAPDYTTDLNALAEVVCKIVEKLYGALPKTAAG